MNTEDIIRWAREIGFDDYEQDAMLLRFFKLAYEAGAATTKQEMLEAGNDKWLEEARRQEREACAKVCEELDWYDRSAWQEAWKAGTVACAAAIRARSQS